MAPNSTFQFDKMFVVRHQNCTSSRKFIFYLKFQFVMRFIVSNRNFVLNRLVRKFNLICNSPSFRLVHSAPGPWTCFGPFWPIISYQNPTFQQHLVVSAYCRKWKLIIEIGQSWIRGTDDEATPPPTDGRRTDNACI